MGYLCTDARVAALNVSIWLLNLAHEVRNDGSKKLRSPSAFRAYVVGNSKDGKKRITLSAIDRAYYDSWGGLIDLVEGPQLLCSRARWRRVATTMR